MERRFSAPSTDDAPPTGLGRGATVAPPPPIPPDMQKTLVVEEPFPEAAPAPRTEAEPAAAPQTEADPAAAPQAPRGPRLQPRRRRRIRLKHILPAWSVSLVVHLLIFTALAAATFHAPNESRPIDFDTALGGADRAIEALPILDDPTDARADRLERPIEVAPGPSAESLAADERPDIGSVLAGAGTATATPAVRGPAARGDAEGRFLALEGLKGRNLSSFSNVPAALGTDLAVAGRVGGDPTFNVSGIDEAMSQLTREILLHLQDHKLTVVWLFDKSASMRDDQRVIREEFDRVTTELADAVDPEKKAAGALNHVILAFGREMQVILGRPSFDADEIRRAMKEIPVDSSGDEATMHAIHDAVERYAGHVGKDRRLILVLVTDESGDDGESVEEALAILRKTRTALFVLGRQSIFGYPYAHHRYVDPITKDVYHPTVRRGPETADVECFQWDGLYGRWDEQPSGFGPWELARLAKESGGIYFLLPSEEFMRVRQREKAFKIEVLKEFMPEYASREVYAQRRAESDLRRSLHALIDGTRELRYRREFPIDAEGQASAALEEGPKATERLNALLGVQEKLEALKRHREREPEPRWRAHYDLMLAQTIVFQIKAYEYRALMQQMARSPQVPNKRPTPDLAISFVVDHSSKPLAPEKETAKKYVEARRLLDDVVAAYPGTPWADLAKDTLARGFSVVLNQWERSPKYEERNQYVPKY